MPRPYWPGQIIPTWNPIHSLTTGLPITRFPTEEEWDEHCRRDGGTDDVLCELNYEQIKALMRKIDAPSR